MKLFEPITIRGMTLKNRVVMSPMGTNFSLVRGASRAFYEERAKGGVGAIVVGGVTVDALTSGVFAQAFYDWAVRPVQALGAKMGPQLFHGNLYPSYWGSGVIQEWVAPSPGTPPGAKVMIPMFRESQAYCRELTIAEIEDIISRYAAAAKKAKEVGFDFIEMHGPHGHNLPHQFFSPIDNHRSDRYGGNLAGRMRFSIEAAKAIRAAVGEDYPFFWRSCAEEGLPGGYTLAECTELCVQLEKAGVDVIDVSFGHEANYEPMPLAHFTPCPGEEQPTATFVPMAEAIKKRVSVPVIGVGRIHALDVAEQVLSQGKVDLVAIGRQLLADPRWPQKIAAGSQDEVTPCLCCNHCIDILEKMEPIRCSVNAAMGQEDEWIIRPAEQKKKVLVVGGGPGGMEAARVAALRGHQVALFERTKTLGGQLLLACQPPRKSKLKDFVNYLSGQMQKQGVRVELGKQVTPELIAEIKPDTLVLATGVETISPEIPGMNRSNVVKAEQVLSGSAEVGPRVAVIGGGEVGCEVAELLAEKGKKVVVVEFLDEMATKLSPRARHFLLYNLAKKGVAMVTGARCQEITDKGLSITSRRGKQQTISADSIVLAVGSRPNTTLARKLEGKVKSIHLVGDCVEPRRIVHAISEGFRVGCDL